MTITITGWGLVFLIIGIILGTAVGIWLAGKIADFFFGGNN